MPNFHCMMEGDSDTFSDSDEVFVAEDDQQAVISYVIEYQMEVSGNVLVKPVDSDTVHTYFVEVVRYPDEYKATLV
jgi:hypothetical protein